MVALALKRNEVVKVLRCQPHLVDKVDTTELTNKEKRDLILLNHCLADKLDLSDFDENDVATTLLLAPSLVNYLPVEVLSQEVREILVRHHGELSEALATNE